jgi:geranylgeranyl reductase family protein
MSAPAEAGPASGPPPGPLDTDVAIVGGGPAGATAARLLAEGGRAVLLLEAGRSPRPKACGGGIPRRALDRLGLHLPGGMGTPVEAVSLLGGLAGPLRMETPGGALVVRRERFDAFLVEAARAAGARIREGCRVRDIGREEGRFRLRASDGTVIAARAVVCADGAASPAARALGFPRNATGVALVRRLRGTEPAPPGRTALFDLACIRTGYAWAFPEPEGWNAGIGVFTPRAPGLPKRFARWRARQPALAPAAGGPLRGGLLPVYGAARTRYARDGAWLVGDAAGLADPLTGEGIHFAVESARLAAGAILRGGETAYDAALRAELLPELDAAARLAARFRRTPAWARAGAMTLPGFRRFAELFVDLLLGRSSCREILRRLEARSLRGGGLSPGGG